MSGRVRLLAALIALGCSAERGVQRAPEPSRPPPSLAAKVAAPVVPSESDVLDLERFAPLLSEPLLADAREALDGGDPAGAAAAVRRVMTEAPPSKPAVMRWNMLLGLLLEKAERLAEAAAAYDLAAKADWPLTGYANLGSGRMLLRAGHPAEAIERLSHVRTDDFVAGEARLLTAEARVLAGDPEGAVALWRAHLSGGEPASRLSVSLRLAEALLDAADAARARKPGTLESPDVAPTAPSASVVADEVLPLVRRAAVDGAGDADVTRRATALERRALEPLAAAERALRSVHSPDERLVALEAMVEARRFSEADAESEGILAALPKSKRWGPLGCEVTLLRAKALAGVGKWGKAADQLGEAVRSCTGDDLRARALYLAGKYAQSDKRYAQAIRFYGQLESELPEHRLADDARLRAAMTHLVMGAEARFTELLSRMPDDYPTGDMVLDGLFQLVTRRLEKADWSGAAAVLERAAALAAPRDRARGHEFAARERYFLARAKVQLGEMAAGLDEYERIVVDYPLSYYMLHAYARLSEKDTERARRAREEAMRKAAVDPFSIEYRAEFDTPAFRRVLELLRLGEVELAKKELAAFGVPQADAEPNLLWTVALLYARSGAYELSHRVARGLLTDWLQRWPAGDWVRAWELAFPRPYHAIVQREAQKNGVPEYLVYAVMREESAFQPEVVSHANAYGLMQLIEPTARHYAKKVGLPSDPASLGKPRINIALGCRVLGDLTRRFSDNPLLAVPGYNAGPGRPKRWRKELPASDFDVWVELIPYRETRRYTKRVLASRAAYAFLYDEAAADDAMRLPISVD